MKNIFRDHAFTLTAGWTFNQLAYAIVYPFIPLYLSGERHIPYSTVGLIFPLIGLMSMIAPLAAGPMTDRFGRLFMMDLGQFGRGMMFLILSWLVWINASFWVIAAVLMLNTAVGTAFQVGSDAYLTDITKEEERPGYYSKIRIGYNLGWALGPMIGAFFSATPFWFFFLITAALCFAGGIFTHLTCRAPKISVIRKERTEEIDRTPVVKLIWQNRRLVYLLAGGIMLFSLSSQLYSTFSVFSVQTVGISKKALGILYSINATQVILLQLPVTSLLKKWNLSLKLQLILGTLAYLFGYLSVGFCTAAWQEAFAIITLTFGEIIIIPALFASVSNETAPKNAGRILAAYSLFRGLGYAVGPWFGAQFFQYIKSPVMLWGALGMFAVTALFFFSLPWHHSDSGKIRVQQ